MSKKIDSKEKTFPKVAVFVLFVILIFNILALTGCYNSKYQDNTGILYTLQDVENYVKNTYFDENGKAKIDEYWKHAFNVAFPEYKFPRDKMQEPFCDNLENLEITEFTVSLVKGIRDGKRKYFLVEFEPIGHMFGALGEDRMKYFGYCSSPFKVFNIPEENRYVFPSDGCIRPDEAAIIDGKLLTLTCLEEPYSVINNDLKLLCKKYVYTKYGRFEYETSPYAQKLTTFYTIPIRLQMALYGTIKFSPFGNMTDRYDCSIFMDNWE